MKGVVGGVKGGGRILGEREGGELRSDGKKSNLIYLYVCTTHNCVRKKKKKKKKKK